jgi:hypothetical protein
MGEGFDLATEFQDVLGRMRERERERQIEVLLKKSEREEWSLEDKALYRQLTGTGG